MTTETIMNDSSAATRRSDELWGRIKGLLARPAEEWRAIAAEQEGIAGCFRHFALPLILIGPIADFLGGQLFGFGGMRPRIPLALATLLLEFAKIVACLFVVAALVNILAPRFGGRSDSVRAFRLAAYSAAPALLAGAFGLIPPLGFLMVLGLYSVFVFSEGASAMTGAHDDRVTIFTGAILIAGGLACLVLDGGAAMVESSLAAII